MLTFTGSGLCNLRRSCWMVLSPEFVRIETKTAIKIDSLGKLSTAGPYIFLASAHLRQVQVDSTLSICQLHISSSSRLTFPCHHPDMNSPDYNLTDDEKQQIFDEALYYDTVAGGLGT
nr:hypothetical protein L204_01804 [Cryptococcus depauperatus CBS 7855]